MHSAVATNNIFVHLQFIPGVAPMAGEWGQDLTVHEVLKVHRQDKQAALAGQCWGHLAQLCGTEQGRCVRPGQLHVQHEASHEHRPTRHLLVRTHKHWPDSYTCVFGSSPFLIAATSPTVLNPNFDGFLMSCCKNGGTLSSTNPRSCPLKSWYTHHSLKFIIIIERNILSVLSSACRKSFWTKFGMPMTKN